MSVELLQHAVYINKSGITVEFEMQYCAPVTFPMHILVLIPLFLTNVDLRVPSLNMLKPHYVEILV